MGICLSCLKPIPTEQEDDNESLLSNDRAKIIEDELVSELRNKQLNAILNSTNDHLIDIGNFKQMSNYGSTQSTSQDGEDGDNDNDNDNEDSDNVFKVSQIPDITIQSEMNSQLADWNAKYGEITVRKYLEVAQPTDDGDHEKYVVEFV